MYTLSPTAPLGSLNRCRIVDYHLDRSDGVAFVWAEVGNMPAALVYPRAGHAYRLEIRNGECVGLRITATPVDYLDRMQTFVVGPAERPALATALNDAEEAARAAVAALPGTPNRDERRAAVIGALETYLRGAAVGLLPAGA